MSDKSAIEWTDASWNPVRGCTKVSAGCKNCYAETFAERFRGVPGHPFEQGFDLRLVPEKLDLPLRWKKPRRIFVNSMSDLFHDDVPDDYIDRVYGVMAVAHQHTFQVLTKRSSRMRAYLGTDRRHQWARWAAALTTTGDIGFDAIRSGPTALPNVWQGVSVEDQRAADLRIPDLLATPAAMRFLSCEPLLGRVSIRGLAMQPERVAQCGACGRGHGFTRCPNYGGVAPTRSASRPDESECEGFVPKHGIGWVIVGGESGPGARPMNTAWAARLVDEAHAIGAACFVKQLGARPVAGAVGYRGTGYIDVDEPLAPLSLTSRKGGDPAEWPESLRVRQFPRAVASVEAP